MIDLPPMEMEFDEMGQVYLNIYTNDVVVNCDEGILEYGNLVIRVGKCVEVARKGKSYIKLQLV